MGIYDMRTYKWIILRSETILSLSQVITNQISIWKVILYNNLKKHFQISATNETVRGKTFGKESRYIYNNKESVLLALKQFSQSQVALLGQVFL